MNSDSGRLPHIVVLGAGFGGLAFCRVFSGRARITLVDRQNHHLFQPLLYQVATASLSGPDIAQPVRAILRKKPALTVRMSEVKSVRERDRPSRNSPQVPSDRPASTEPSMVSSS